MLKETFRGSLYFAVTQKIHYKTEKIYKIKGKRKIIMGANKRKGSTREKKERKENIIKKRMNEKWEIIIPMFLAQYKKYIIEEILLKYL